MKTFVIVRPDKTDNSNQFIGWYFLTESAVSNAGKPFFMPENNEKVMAFMAPVFKITRLGKSISQKFSQRYFTELAPGIHFILPDLKEKFSKNRLPEDPAVCFDRSLFAGSFEGLENGTVPHSMNFKINGDEIVSCSSESLKELMVEIIPKISTMNTLKTGDMVVPVLYGEKEIKYGDVLTIESEEKEILRVKIK